LLLAFVWAELAALPREAPTVDEQNHIARGLSVLATGDRRLYIGHPPLLNAIAAFPLLFDARIHLPLDGAAWRDADWIQFAIELFWKRDNPALPMLFAARMMVVLLGVVFLAALYRLGADVGGRWAGLLSVAFAVLDPNLRAHSRLATTDLGLVVTLTLTLWLWRRWQRRTRWALALLAGAALGLALVSKYTALIYVPALGLVIGLAARSRRLWGQSAGAAAAAALTAWSVYGFEMRPALGFTFPVPLASYWEELLSASVVFERYTYLLGQVARQGSWAYFPVALAVKTPLPLLLASGVGLAHWFARRWRSEAVLWLPAVVFLGAAISSRVNIGYRHILPVLPLLYLGAALALLGLWRRRRWGRWAAGALMAWLVVNSVFIYPRDLTFFNEIAGGPDNGWRFLVDSNLDWGQDLGELVDYVRAHNITSIYLSYFGSVPWPVKEYPLPARALPPRPTPDWRPLRPSPGWYAISLNHLLGAASLDDPDTFAYFRRQTPEAILGRTIYIYRVPDESGTVAACTNPAPYIGRAQAQSLFGARLERFINFDCEQGLPLPSGRTWYIVRGGQRAPVAEALARLGARLVYQEDYIAETEQAWAVYQLDDAAAAARRYSERSVAPQTFGGLATLLGYHYRAPLQPGPVQAQTVWRIEANLPEPLSIFLHLAAPDGFVLAGSDGFNTPFEQLRPGDALIQFHALDYPDALPEGSQWRVGLYRLQGEQARYRLPQGADAFPFAP
jgi:hypothetical protein